MQNSIAHGRKISFKKVLDSVEFSNTMKNFGERLLVSQILFKHKSIYKSIFALFLILSYKVKKSCAFMPNQNFFAEQIFQKSFA